jgi:hypothetical protein
MKSQSKQLVEAMALKGCEGWLACQNILTDVLTQHPELPSILTSDIRMNISATNNLLTLLLLYSHTPTSYAYRSRYEALSTETHY